MVAFYGDREEKCCFCRVICVLSYPSCVLVACMLWLSCSFIPSLNVVSRGPLLSFSFSGRVQLCFAYFLDELPDTGDQLSAQEISQVT